MFSWWEGVLFPSTDPDAQLSAPFPHWKAPTSHSNKRKRLPTNSEAHWVFTLMICLKKRDGLSGELMAFP